MDAPTGDQVVRLASTVYRSIHLQVCEARNLPKLRGVFASVHLSSQMGRTAVFHKTRNPLWADEFTFEVIDPHDVVKIFIMEDKKKGVQKKVGEIRVILATLPANQRTEAWLPIAGEKNKTVGDVRLRLQYSVDVLLPSVEYNSFLELLGAEDLEIIRLVSRFARENKSEVARDLVNIFQSRGRVEWLIGQLLKEEIQSTETPEVLFRSNSVCTKALDHYMKNLGQEYLMLVVKPLVHAVQKLANVLEVDKNRITSGDDYKKNLKMIQIILEDLIARLSLSLDQCPVPLRRLFAIVDRLAKEKFKDAEKIRYTSVGGFIFLRFFVPAILNPKLFGLMEHLPDDKQSRTLSLLAGVVQKIANLTKYREGDDYLVLLNDFIVAKTTVTKDYVDKLVDVPDAPFQRSRSMTRRSSVATPVMQVEHHVASLLRELQPIIPKFKDELFRPNVVKLLEILDKLEQRVKDETIALDEIGLSPTQNSAKDLDSLVSDLIKSSNTPIGSPAASPAGRSRSATSTASPAPLAKPTSTRMTVKRLKKKGDAAAPGVDTIFSANSALSTQPAAAARAASSAYTAKQDAVARANMGAKLGGPVADISAFIAPGTQEKEAARSRSPPARAPPPAPGVPPGEQPTTAAGAVLMNLRKEQVMQRKGSAPPMPTSRRNLLDPAKPPAAPSSVQSDSPRTAARQKALAPHKDDVAELSDDGVPLQQTETQQASSSSSSSTSTETEAPLSESARILQDLNRLLQEEALLGVEVPTPQPKPSAVPVVPSVSLPVAPVAQSASTTSAKSSQTPPKPTLALPAMNFGHSVPVSPGDLITPRRAVVTLTPRNEVVIEEDVEVEEAAPDASAVEVDLEYDESSSDDEEDMEEVEVIDMSAARSASQKALERIDAEFAALSSMINEIATFERPATPRQRPPEEVIPEISTLDQIVQELSVLQAETGRRAKEAQTQLNGTMRRRSLAPARIVCHACDQLVSPGQGFLIALGRQYHDNHLLCTSCKCDLSSTGLHDMDGEPYCTNCYTRAIKLKSAPKCAGCHGPIVDNEYFTALDQTWHVEHFVCTTCKNPFDDGRFFMVNDKPYCDAHSRAAKPKQSRGTCDYCQQDIYDAEYMDAQGKKWHKEHFLCDKCGLPMEGMFVLYDKGRKKGCAHHFQK